MMYSKAGWFGLEWFNDYDQSLGMSIYYFNDPIILFYKDIEHQIVFRKGVTVIGVDDV
jgi:hypothetical protein